MAATATPVIIKRPVAKKMGRLAPKSDPRALMFSRFGIAPKKLPKSTHFWNDRTKFEHRTFGNDQYGDCTRASQAIGAMRMERLETRRTPHITDEEVVRVFLEMCKRLYRGNASGGYIMDALNCWRRPEYTFRDEDGNALTIDAYVKVHPSDQTELRQAIWTAAAHGIVVGLNLPRAFDELDPPKKWDIPEDQPAIGDWVPGSGGGHAMWARDYDEKGIWLVHTWDLPDQLITWRAAALYLDEAYIVIDSVDKWREQKRAMLLPELRKAVNEISSFKLKD